jgi:hypothetical protein
MHRIDVFNVVLISENNIAGMPFTGFTIDTFGIVEINQIGHIGTVLPAFENHNRCG